jgi:hypothetical protein
VSTRIFASADWDHVFSRTARKVTGQDRTHAGIHRTEVDMSFEQRLMCRYYPWGDYQKPGMRVEEWEIKLPRTRVNEAFVRLRDRFIGRRYGIGQLLNMTTALLWAKVGVKREMSVRRGLVCSELVWHFIDELGGMHQRTLREVYRDPNIFTPGDLKVLCDGCIRLYERVE